MFKRGVAPRLFCNRRARRGETRRVRRGLCGRSAIGMNRRESEIYFVKEVQGFVWSSPIAFVTVIKIANRCTQIAVRILESTVSPSPQTKTAV
jgi:hypothetical protein